MPQYFGQLHTHPTTWRTLGAVESIQRQEQQIIFECGIPCLSISILAANLIRVRVTPTGEFSTRRSWAVTQPDEEWANVAFTVQEKPDCVEIETEQMRVVVSLNPCSVKCFDSSGEPFA